MSDHPMDDILEAEGSLCGLNTLIEVIADMAIDAADTMSDRSVPADKATADNLAHMMRIARDLSSRATNNLKGATRRMIEGRNGTPMVGGKRNG